MLSWICPDCGCDCAPTDPECPDCADLVQAGMVALARAVDEHRSSLPPEPEIPLQELVPAPSLTVAPKAAAPLPPRYIDPQPEAIAASAPLMALLPEPSVTPALAPLDLAEPPAVPRRFALPGWLISVLVATILSLGGAAIIRNMDSDHKAAAAESTATAASSTGDQNIEVTGLRVVGGPRFGSQLQYIVVNHSSSALSNLNLRINVLSNARGSGHPLFTISAMITGLAPFSSREMATEIDDVHASDVPEWGDLRTRVEVLRQ